MIDGMTITNPFVRSVGPLDDKRRYRAVLNHTGAWVVLCPEIETIGRRYSPKLEGYVDISIVESIVALMNQDLDKITNIEE